MPLGKATDEWVGGDIDEKMAGDMAVRGAQTLRHNGYKVPLVRNLVRRAIRGSEGGTRTS